MAAAKKNQKQPAPKNKVSVCQDLTSIPEMLPEIHGKFGIWKFMWKIVFHVLCFYVSVTNYI